MNSKDQLVRKRLNQNTKRKSLQLKAQEQELSKYFPKFKDVCKKQIKIASEIDSSSYTDTGHLPALH